MNSTSQKASNYTLLKKDEQNVMNLFYSCFKKIITAFNDQINILQSFKDFKEVEDLYDLSLKEEKNIMINIKDIQDECIWLIQKHEPRASHLRFLIAIINSLNDLKRISNYIVSYAKFFSKYYVYLSDEMKKIVIVDISHFCLKTTNEYYESLKNHHELSIANSTIIFDNFLKEYKRLYLNFINQSTIESYDSNLIANLIILIKNIDRTIDHCVNIVDNFCNIK